MNRKPYIIPSKTNNKNMERYLQKKLSEVGEGGSGGGSDPEAIKYTEQTLTEAQKQQARNNIDAASLADIENFDYVTAATLPTASAETMGHVYLIGPDASNNYERYYTQQNGSSYSWIDLGSTQLDLSTYATEEEVSQLEAKLSDVVIVDLLTVADGHYDGKGIGVNGAIFNLSGRTVWYKLFSEETTIDYDNFYTSNGAIMYAMGGTAGNPSDKTMVNTTGGTGSAIIPAGGRLYWVDSTSEPGKTKVTTTAYGDIKDFATKLDIVAETEILVDAANRERAVKMKADRYSSVLADWMQVVSEGASQNNNTVMSVVSSTSSSVTLSAEDAAQFVVKGPAVVHFTNGDCKMVYFDVPSGTSISEMPGQDIDLTNADYIQNLHDTARGGGGIHLSQLGYIMLAQFTAQEMASKLSQKDSNLLASVMMYNSTESTDKKAVKDVNGNVCATVETDFATSGFTPNNNGLLATYGIVSNDMVNSTNFGFLYQAFRFQQGEKDKYLTITVPATGRGFVEIECGKSPRKTTSTGTATMKLYADGTLVDTVTVKSFYHRFQFSGVSARKSISVKFIIDENTDTEVGIYSINFYAMDDIVPAINLTGKKVAVLGDSWTQFPGLANAISLYPDYNTVGTRPDGTDLDGLAYFVKEFARVTGAVCDNWGHSNMRADNWGLEKIDTILAFKQYDYLIVEFFTNDENASITAEAWAANIALIAEKCKRACVRPLIMLPCRNNGSTVNPLGVYHETALRGLGMM